MPKESAESRHLFAAYAIKLGYCSPAQITDAVRVVERDDSLSLADVLERLGALDRDKRRHIDGVISRDAEDAEDTLHATRGDQPGKVGKPRATADPPTVVPHVERSSKLDVSGAWIPPGDPSRYTIEGLHARGGQGQIFLATDQQIGREIAIKEFLPDVNPEEWARIPESEKDSRTDLVRFLREARVTGQLTHPNIVPVHELGQNRHGVPYYTMRFVRGQTLSMKLKQCKTLGDRLALLGAFWDLCKAIAFAHSRNVVHRDIKPRNVMVGEFGETVVLDWGLAKVEGRDDLRATDLARAWKPLEPDTVHHTSTGTALGTPAYMSPEQARGKLDRIDARSDVWGLGAVLYQILTGTPPYRAKNTDETLKAVIYLPLAPVRERCPEAPPELAAVAEKALQKKRHKRYQAAKELADEIGAYMTGGRVHAYAYTSWELLKRFASQNRPTIIAAALVFAVIIGALVSVTFALRAETHAREAEQQARTREQAERRVANFHLAEAYLEKADRMAADIRFPTAAVMASASLLHNPVHPLSPFHDAGFFDEVPPSREKRLQAASRVYRLSMSPGAELQRSFRVDASLSSVAFSPAGTHLAVASLDHTVRVWDVMNDVPPRTFRGHADEVFGVSFAPDGRTLASCGEDGRIILWDLATGRHRATLKGHKGMVRGVIHSPDGRWLASAGMDGTVRLWDAASNRQVHVLRGHRGKVFAVDFSPDGRSLASTGTDATVRIWDTNQGTSRLVLTGHTDEVRSVRFSPTGELLASVGIGEQGSIRLWDPSSGKPAGVLKGHLQGAMDLAFSPDGTYLATAGYDGTARFWDVRNRTMVLTIEGHSDFLYGVAYAPDGNHVATAGFDKRVRVWRVHPEERLTALPAHSDLIRSIVVSKDGRLLASGGRDQLVHVWVRGEDQHDWRLKYKLSGHRNQVQVLALHPNGRWLASGSQDRTVRIWDLRTGSQRFVLRGHLGSVNGLAYSPDGAILATSGDDRAVRIWDMSTRFEIRVLRGHEDLVFHVAFSPDGQRLASASFDRTARIWEYLTEEPPKVLTHPAWLTAVAFSPDGRHLATSGKDGQVSFWDPGSGELVRRFPGHTQWVETLVFSPDGEQLATASHDNSARVWSVRTGETLLILETEQICQAVAFLPDGKTVAVGDNRLVRLYPLDFSADKVDPRELLEKAERRAGMRLSGFELEVADR